jgi:hypothetical protein
MISSSEVWCFSVHQIVEGVIDGTLEVIVCLEWMNGCRRPRIRLARAGMLKAYSVRKWFLLQPVTSRELKVFCNQHRRGDKWSLR